MIVGYQNRHKDSLLFDERLNIQYLELTDIMNINSTKNIRDNTSSSLNDRSESLLNLTTKNQYNKDDLELIKSQGKKFAIYDNYLIDITKIMYYHPGGIIHLEETLYNDISRFVTGTVSLNKNFSPYNHSYSAVNYLHTKIFGVIYENHQIIIDANLGNR